MDNEHIPVLPRFGDDIRHPAEIQAFLDQMDEQ
jgi:general secretion pathway protein D